MIETNVNWHKPSEKLPTCSCMVLAIIPVDEEFTNAIIQYIPFSEKYKSFFVLDDGTAVLGRKVDSEDNNTIIKYWTYADLIIHQLKEKTADYSE